MSRRIKKYLMLLANPTVWPALSQGVAATVEHAAALGCDEYATVIDVGANKGQFAIYARTRWPRARLVCFEPLPGPRAKLARVTGRQTEIHECALGATPGEGRMYLASRTDSSSLLPLGARQKEIFGMTESGELQVPIRRLDACLSTPLQRPALLKIDVQGFELEVLKGVTGLLSEIDSVYVEASDQELYEGQALQGEIKTFLEVAGFQACGYFNEQFYHGQRIQADCLFRRL
jgi:FkbM family methyltransferase